MSSTVADPTIQEKNAQPSGAPRSKLLSIVIPCLNEETVVGEFVDWCHQGMRSANIQGEVLIIDSSTDRSPQIAEAHGARVISVPKRGLGQAYRDAMPHIRGDYVIMGDADLTYDFRELAPFLDKLDEGCEFVMGTRTKGTIEPGAMPALHRYFGSPLTNGILNLVYHSRFSDIHCGMRAMTLDALRQINLQCSSWEYASEMILKASRMRMRTAEVPIKFYKDREGRESHLKRGGWKTPWIAGWLTLKVIFTFAPDFLLFWPGLIMLLLGLLLNVGLFSGPRTIGSIGFNLHWMLLGITMASIGHNGLRLALLAKVFHNFRPAVTREIRRLLSYNRCMIAGGLLIAAGLALEMVLVIQWISRGLRLANFSHAAVFGLLLLILGSQEIIHTLILQMVRYTSRDEV